MAARLINEQGQRQDLQDDFEVGDWLNKGYNFENPSVMVRTPENEVHNVDAGQARQLIMAGKADYLSDEGFQELKDEKKYGSGYMLEAAGLSAANALTFGGFSEIMKRVGFPEVEQIEKYNPGISLAGDIVTTGAAMALAGTGVGAPLAAPILTKQALKMAAREGAGALTKLGVKSIGRGLQRGAKYTGPGAVAVLGKKSERAIVSKILGEAAEEQIKKSVKRGLSSRMLTMGAEGAMFAAGYSLVDAAGALYEGREPQEVASTFLSDVGTGLLIGGALPAVFHLPGIAGAKLFKGASGLAQRGFNWAADTQASKDFFEKIVDAVAATDPENFATVKQKQELAEKLRHTTNIDEAMAVFEKLTTKKDEVITSIGGQLRKVMEAQKLIREVDQQGHTPEFIMEQLNTAAEGTEGAQSMVVLYEVLLNGMGKFKQTGVQEGLLDTLETLTRNAIDDGTRLVDTAIKGKQVKRLPPEYTEMKGILDEIRSIRELTTSHMDRAVSTPKWSAAHSQWQTINHELTGPDKGKYQKIASHLMSFPDFKRIQDNGFTSEVFSRLERVASRAHKAIKKGPFQDTDFHQKYMNEMKENITAFITNSGNRGWDMPRSLKGEAAQLTPFGPMSEAKAVMNTLMTNRDTQYDMIKSAFFKPHPKHPAVLDIADEVKIADFVNKLDHKTSDYNMKLVRDFADNQADLMNKLKGRYKLPVGVDKPRLQKYVDETQAHKKEIEDGIEFLTQKMKPALEYYGILERERIAGLSGANPGLLPYAFGAGIGAMFGGVPGAGAGLAGGAAFRFSQEMILNPGRAMAKLHTFFRTVNAYDEFLTKQVDRYFSWINYAKKSPQAGRLVWSPDKHEKIKYSRLWTSNAMARLVTGGQYEGEANSKAGTAYRKEELKNTVAISNAISRDPEIKEKIISATVADYEAVDPNLAGALREKVTAHLDGVEKLVADIQPRSQPPFGDMYDFEVDDTKAEEIGPVIQIMERGTPVVMSRMYDGTLTHKEAETYREYHPEEAQKLAEKFLGFLADPDNRIGISMIDENLMKMIIGIPPVAQDVASVLAAAYMPDEKPGPQARGEMKNVTSAETAMQQLESRMG